MVGSQGIPHADLSKEAPVDAVARKGAGLVLDPVEHA